MLAQADSTDFVFYIYNVLLIPPNIGETNV